MFFFRVLFAELGIISDFEEKINDFFGKKVLKLIQNCLSLTKFSPPPPSSKSLFYLSPGGWGFRTIYTPEMNS